MDQGALLIVSAPHFVAGLVYKERAAPIISYMADWEFAKIKWYCRRKKWSLQKYSELLKSGIEV